MTMESNPKSQAGTGAIFGAAAVDRLSEQVKSGHQAWMGRIKEMQAVEAEFTKELLTTRDPNEALKLCNRWIARRIELLAADAKAFSGFWMDLVTTAAAGAPKASGAPTSTKSEDT